MVRVTDGVLSGARGPLLGAAPAIKFPEDTGSARFPARLQIRPLKMTQATLTPSPTVRRVRFKLTVQELLLLE